MHVNVRTKSSDECNKVAMLETDSMAEAYAFVTLFSITIHKDVEKTTIHRDGDKINILVVVPDDVNRTMFDLAMRMAAIEVYQDM